MVTSQNNIEDANNGINWKNYKPMLEYAKDDLTPKKANWVSFGVNVVLLALIAIMIGIVWFFIWPASFSFTALLLIAGYSFFVAPVIFFICLFSGW